MSDVRYKLIMDVGGERLGALLRAVASLGSINRAAAQLKVSYRHAWGLIKQAEEQLGAPLLEKRVGGAAGGGAALTPAGRDLLARFDQVRTLLADAPVAPPTRPVLLASTIGPAETGLVGALEEAFYQATGLLVRHIAAGTGQALEIAREGRADLVLAHAPDLERSFLADGYGLERFPLMYNDFLLLGPASDPADAGQAASAAEALRRCASAGAPFVSRGDRSGTHIKELDLWAAAGTSPEAPWYSICPRGSMGSMAALRYAEERQSYILVDRATYLAARQTGLTLSVLCAGDPSLRNEFALLTVNPARLPGVQEEGARRFAAWAVSPAGQLVIHSFGLPQYGEPLFFPAHFGP